LNNSKQSNNRIIKFSGKPEHVQKICVWLPLSYDLLLYSVKILLLAIKREIPDVSELAPLFWRVQIGGKVTYMITPMHGENPLSEIEDLLLAKL